MRIPHQNKKRAGNRLRGKSIVRTNGKSFVAGGISRKGHLYAVGTRRIANRLYLKGSIGTQGVRVGLKYASKPRSVEGDYNLTTKTPTLKIENKQLKKNAS